MSTADPFDFVNRHRDTIFRVMGVLAVLLVLFLLLRFLAMRQGGWKAGWARLRRECAITAHAFAAPFRAWRRHRRSLRILVRGLRTPATWRDAERAVAAAREAGGLPYAAIVAEDVVTVLVAGRNVPPPADGPWWADEEDEDPEEEGAGGGGASGYWNVARDDLPPVVPDPDQRPPVLVAIGETDGCCAFLDVSTGPPTFSVEGDRRVSTALHQAIAAQLDVRLPEGLVVVAEGVNREFPGPPVRTAYRNAAELRPRLGVPPVLVTAELPAPLPPELSAPPTRTPGLRLLLLGPGKGYTRTLLTDRHGQTILLGSPLLTLGIALSRAIVRVLSELPPVLPPGPSGASGADGASRPFTEVEDDEEASGTAETDDWSVPTPAALVPRPPSAERDDEQAEEEAAKAPEPAVARTTPELDPEAEPELVPESEAATPSPAGASSGGRSHSSRNPLTSRLDRP
jgi:hypothetical protein